jgi:hypothetical protein
MREPRIYVAEHSGKDASRDAVGLVAFNPIGSSEDGAVTAFRGALIRLSRWHAVMRKSRRLQGDDRTRAARSVMSISPRCIVARNENGIEAPSKKRCYRVV